MEASFGHNTPAAIGGVLLNGSKRLPHIGDLDAKDIGAILMTGDEAAAVQTSYARIKAAQVDLAAAFYARLFETAPELRALFSDDIAAQSHKLNVTLEVLIKNLENIPEFLPSVLHLARRHISYGVVPHHYDLVRDTLIDTVTNHDAVVLTQDEATAWSKSITMLAQGMKDHVMAPLPT